MSQIYPNFQRPDSALGGPAPIQTTRTSYTVTSNDISASHIDIPVTLPVAFADVNYTLSLDVEVKPASGLGSGSSYSAVASSKTASGFNVHVTSLTNAGDVLVLHVTAIHD